MIVGNTQVFWEIFSLSHSVHNIPANDLKEHVMDKDGTCWCHPKEDDEYVNCWIHNSMDGRENYHTSKDFH